MHDELLRYGINYVGAEVLFTSDTDTVATEEFIHRMHNDNCLVWANAIIYNHKSQLAAGHSDDTALSVDPKLGWGWLAERGFDFIQTDWTGLVVDYLKKNNIYYK